VAHDDRTARGANIGAKLRAFWSEESGLTALLVMLLVYYVTVPLVAGRELARMVAALCFTLLAASGLLAVIEKPRHSTIVRVAGVVALVAVWSEVVAPGRATIVAACIGDATLVSFLLIAVAAQVFQTGPVTGHRIRGAIVIYLLIGVLFGLLFYLDALLQQGAFKFTSELDPTDPFAVKGELAYFSFVTLTTLGYGDITPVSPTARSMATLEAMSGQLYIAITLAQLVASQLADRTGSGSPPGEGD
jgi:hypothetical protein